VNGDADGLPGLILDRYGDGLSLQLLTQAAARREQITLERLEALFSPRVVVLRNDGKVSRMEGLPQEKRLLKGEDPQIFLEADGLSWRFDLMEGQKTGGFLDQRENQEATARFLSGECLDAFCYEGGFSLRLAREDRRVLAVDSSEPALERLRRNAERNSLSLKAQRANVFDLLREFERERRRFDGIILDPPAFAPSRKALKAGRRAYKEINLRALKLLRPGGRLVTFSCSAHMQRADFERVLLEAAVDARRWVRVQERRSAGVDHPSLLSAPETDYLKALFLEVE